MELGYLPYRKAPARTMSAASGNGGVAEMVTQLIAALR
jgi:hypothetical protein